ncbi:protein of unknown function [Paraburkholderia kururiensis]
MLSLCRPPGRLEAAVEPGEIAEMIVARRIGLVYWGALPVTKSLLNAHARCINPAD